MRTVLTVNDLRYEFAKVDAGSFTMGIPEEEVAFQNITAEHKVTLTQNYFSTFEHAVATKKPNELGIYDMSGNEWEWCGDLWGNYSSEPQTDPQGPEGDEDGEYVLRSGCCVDRAKGCRVTARSQQYCSLEGGGSGFRIAFTPWKGH